MKIITPGDPDARRKKYLKIFTCTLCGCVFEAEAGEYESRAAGYNETDYVAVCPCCGENTYNWRACE